MLSKIHAITYFTIIDSLRNKILRALIILALILSATNIFIAELFSWDLGKVSIDTSLSTAAVTGLVVIFFFCFKILTEDIEHHSIYLIMARPVTIREYILGKFLGLSSILFLTQFVLGLGAFASMSYIIWRFPGYIPQNFSWFTFIAAMFYQLLALMIVLSFSFMWFAFAVQPFVALLFSISTYLIGQNMELLRRLILMSEETHMSFQKMVVVTISWIFPNLSFFNLKTAAAYGLPLDWDKLLNVALYGFSYIGIMLVLTTFFYNKKDLS